MPRGSKPGERRGGRRKGTPNKNTAAVKEAIEQAFENIGGVPALVAWAKKNPTLFYLHLFPKLLPLQVNHAGRDSGPIEVRWQTAGEADAKALPAASHQNPSNWLE
jgi:hypothetical protein